MRILEHIVGYPDEINNLIQTVSKDLVEFANESIPDWDFSNYYTIGNSGEVYLVFIRKKKTLVTKLGDGKVNYQYLSPVRFTITIPSPDDNYSLVTIRRTIQGEFIEDIVGISELDTIINYGIYWIMGLISSSISDE